MSQSKSKSFIKEIAVRLLKLPLITSFATGFGTITHKETILVKITDSDGIVGWGEAAALTFPDYSQETSRTTLLGLKEYILPLLRGKNVEKPVDALNLLTHIKGFHFAKTAIDCALWTIYSLRSNKSISELLGGNKKKIAIGESIGMKDSIEKTLDEIALRLDQGYQRIKIKIKPGWDEKLIKEVRAKFGDIPLMVDANSSYTLKDINVLKKLDAFDLIMMEQPLGDTDIIDHATLQKHIKTPICLDESILSAEDARKAVEIGACKIINIKPGRVGGISEGKKIHDYCLEKGIGVWCGGLLESGIGRAFNISLSSLPGFKFPADMSPSPIFYKEDLIEPTYIVSNDGTIDVPQIPGLGFNIIEKRVNKYTESKFILK